jgi:hypothetical protein
MAIAVPWRSRIECDVVGPGDSRRGSSSAHRFGVYSGESPARRWPLDLPNNPLSGPMKDAFASPLTARPQHANKEFRVRQVV